MAHRVRDQCVNQESHYSVVWDIGDWLNQSVEDRTRAMFCTSCTLCQESLDLGCAFVRKVESRKGSLFPEHLTSNGFLEGSVETFVGLWALYIVRWEHALLYMVKLENDTRRSPQTRKNSSVAIVATPPRRDGEG